MSLEIEDFYHDLKEESESRIFAERLMDEFNARRPTLSKATRDMYEFLIRENAMKALGLYNRPLLVGRDTPHEATKPTEANPKSL